MRACTLPIFSSAGGWEAVLAREMETGDRPNLEFSLTRGGPLFAILKWAKVLGPGKYDPFRPGLAVASLTWVPMVVLAIVHWVSTSTADPVMRDPAVHVRLIVAIPLFFLGEALLEERCASSFRRVVEGLARERAAAIPIMQKAKRLRDSWLAEGIMLAVSVALGQSALWGFTSGSGVLEGVEVRSSVAPSFAWYAAVGLPLFQFLLLRSLYRWAIWSRMLIALSRIDLDLVPTHPDLAGGLALICEPVVAFAVIVFASSAVVGATWAYRVAVIHVDHKVFTWPFIMLVAICMAVALGPLLFFSLQLTRTRISGLRQYSALARRYTRLFHEKWILERSDEPLLGTNDIQSLADLGNAYEKLESMRFVPFGPRLPIIVLVATSAAMLPVLAMVKPLPELAASLARALLGGLPR
jgi:hypothetical protein